jgi:hypothetical protein
MAATVPVAKVGRSSKISNVAGVAKNSRHKYQVGYLRLRRRWRILVLTCYDRSASIPEIFKAPSPFPQGVLADFSRLLS